MLREKTRASYLGSVPARNQILRGLPCCDNRNISYSQWELGRVEWASVGNLRCYPAKVLGALYSCDLVLINATRADPGIWGVL